MKIGAVVAALLGLGLAAIVVWRSDVGAIGAGLASLGQVGFVAVCAFSLVPVFACAMAMQVLIDPPRPAVSGAFWARLCRDAASDLLGFLPAAGELLAIRTLTLQGIGAAEATAVIIVDLTVELAAQLPFALIGLGLAVTVVDSHVLLWCVAGFAVLVAVVLGFTAIQHSGLFKLIDVIAQRLALDLPAHSLDIGRRIHERLVLLWAERVRLLRSFGVHFLAWLLGVGEAWVALAFMGVHVPLHAIVALESIVYAVRNVAFVVPGAIGVQEGAYAALAPAFGFTPETLLAVSFAKRGRSITLGVPVLLIWQFVEGRRLRWRAK